MYKKHRPICKNIPHIAYGADYNPEQWKLYPQIIEDDMKFMPMAHCNVMTVGVFSWTEYEKEEGIYDFSYLDYIMDKLYSIGVKVILATPSGARPAWMAEQHPEVLRVNADRTKNLYGFRHNHCYTSPYYRRKTYQINELLAKRYKNHPALAMWHISNELGGECHCELCREAFRDWLKNKYDNNLDKINHAYWSSFWSHTYTDWLQIEPPSPIGENQLHGLNLDWKRFVTHQTGEFVKNEAAPLKKYTPEIPVTTNFTARYYALDYTKLKETVDVISWDNYPEWCVEDNVSVAMTTAMNHDINRCLKMKPFFMMESTPSLTNWKEYNKLKKPGMNILTSMQALAHGSDSVQYFQWRKSRGSSEKFHGAIIGHCGHTETRVFKEATKLGNILEGLDEIVGTYTKSEVALIFDWENRWAIDDMQAMGKSSKRYSETCQKHYNPFWKMGINVDVMGSEEDFSNYKIVIAPMLYMIKKDVDKKIETFIKNGGTVVMTYASGWVDENDLCFLGGFPGNKLKEVFGIWMEDIETLCPNESNEVCTDDSKIYKAIDYCELIHSNTAEVSARYTKDFYKGMPAVTSNKYGRGKAYYIAFRDDGKYLDDFYKKLADDLSIERSIRIELPYGVTAHTREDEKSKYIFIENYTENVQRLYFEGEYTEVLSGEVVNECCLDGYEQMVLRCSKQKFKSEK